MTGIEDIIFTIIAGAIVLLSIAVVTVRNPVRSTFFLIASFLPTSALYIMMRASFAGVLQVLVYAGAILILFTFVVMMINPGPGSGDETAEKPAEPGQALSTFILAAFAVFVALCIVAVGYSKLNIALRFLPLPTSIPDNMGTMASLGDLIFKDALNNPLTVSFELISFLILGGIVIAVNLAKGRRS